MTKTNRCTHENKEVTLRDCVECRRLCVDSPRGRQVWLWDRDFVQRWGADEIERFEKECHETQ